MSTAHTDYAVPTGEFILEWLEEMEITQAELSRRMGVSAKHVSKLISGAPLSADVAVKLSLATGIAAEIWLGYEATYRADVARLALSAELAGERQLANSFPLSELRARGVITATMHRPGAVVMELFAFFGVATTEALRERVSRPSLALRQGTAHPASDAALASWWRLVELDIAVADANVHSFSAEALRESVPALRALTRHPPDHFGRELIRRLSEVGVRLTYVPEVKGARVFGATNWSNGQPTIALSLRGVNDGQFWFTFFHEIGHALLHPDGLLHIQTETPADDDAEREADQFATETLIPSEFDSRLGQLTSKQLVIEFAEEIGVSPGVVIGRLWHERMWAFDRGHDLCTRLTIVDDE